MTLFPYTMLFRSSSSTDAYGLDGWKEKFAAKLKRDGAVYLTLKENLHHPAAIQAYEAYQKRREEERKQFEIKFSPLQISFGNALPKETKNIGGQSCPIEDSTDDFATPTLEELPTEYRQAYETLKKKRAEEFEALEKKLKEEHEANRRKLEEEGLHMFHAELKKDPQENITLVGEIKSSLMCCNQVKPHVKPRQEEALQVDGSHGEKMNDSESMVTSDRKSTRLNSSHAQ